MDKSGEQRLVMGSRAVEAAVAGGLGALRQRVQPRRFRAYCIGTPKSGTRSIAGLFEGRYRSRHEPAVASLLELIESLMAPSAATREDRASALRGAIETWRHDPAIRARLVHKVVRRDLRTWLELESSFAAAIVLESLVDRFGEAKFILAVRHPLDWLDSMFDQASLLSQLTARQRLWPDMWFGFDRFEHPPSEELLARHGLYSLDGYLHFWRDHHERVLATVPPERLLSLRTDRIRSSATELADFLGVSSGSLDRSRGHLNQTRERLGLAAGLDPVYLEDKIQSFCGDLLARFVH